MDKNIFQTWKTSEVPDTWKKNQQSIKSFNPNWKYILLTDTDNEMIVKNNFPDFYQTFISYVYPIQRADAIRYIVLYLYGGIYLDLDYTCNKSFDDITFPTDVGLIPSNNIRSRVTNSFLASKKGSPFWLECIKQMKQGIPWYKKLTKHFEIFNSTGPYLVDQVYKKNTSLVTILKDISVPCNVCQVKSCESNNDYYITPTEGNSWHCWDSGV